MTGFSGELNGAARSSDKIGEPIEISEIGVLALEKEISLKELLTEPLSLSLSLLLLLFINNSK
jgi:hypothetical protein